MSETIDTKTTIKNEDQEIMNEPDEDSIKSALDEVRQMYKDAKYEECRIKAKETEAMIKKVGVGVTRFTQEEEVRWLLGLISKKEGSYQKAANLFDEALVCSETLFSMGIKTPTKVCMEALRGRGTCHLYKYSYQSAIYDFKEWLKLREMFWPTLDCVSVLYNVGLCYKANCVFSAAAHWLEKSMTLAKYGGIKQERNYKKSRAAVKLLKEVSISTTEDSLIQEVLHLQILPTETPSDLASKLLSLRTRVHYYLASTSWALVTNTQSRRSSSRWLPLRFVTPPPSPTHPTHTDVRKIIINVATSFLTRLLGGNEVTIRKYLTNGTAPAVLPLLDASSIKTALRQTLNFAAEFTLNYQKMAVWDAVQLTNDAKDLLVTLEEHPPLLPFLTGGGEQGVEAGSPRLGLGDEDGSDEIDPMDHVETAGKEVSFIPRLSGLQGEEPLLDDEKRRLLCKTLPARHGTQHWDLAFSTRLHGFLMSSFLRSTEFVGPNIVVIQTIDGETFGGYTAQSWQPQKYHYGNGETMVFAFKNMATEQDNADEYELCSWQWSGRNRFFVKCDVDEIAFGGGSSLAFSMQGKTIEYGYTGKSESFDNAPLCGSSSYVIKCAECWAFGDDDLECS
eukprot:TRINITY_DN4989_c0_g7_i1.p1 TRINITY_DN4989_c0_g7~~TRINITY_DN4989_c0_g7_i1.p1  ORF type:complete len:659 (+),score=77.01 TRINITY_DN4989_c0_g7_i1:122-1978(+)